MKVLLVDDHAIVRDGLRRLLATLGGEEVVDAADGREALALARSLRPDLAIVDLNLPGLGGLELIRRLAQDAPETRILVLSMHAEPLYVTRAMDAGAHGYLSKNVAPEELLAAVRKVAAGGRYVEGEVAQALAVRAAEADEPMGKLSPRDLEMLRLLAQGRSLAEIADSLGIGYKTVANSFTSIKAKLGVARTADLVRLALEMGVG
ncbi:MAG: response regulator transcription factor [Pseudomonadota bacterium]|jgi:two-component system invasion response regulator UvrY